MLFDIETAIVSIDEHLEGRRDFEEYRRNKTKRRAVERELEMIGKAMNQLLRINPQIDLSYSRAIVDLRNRIIHAYDNINDIIIWKIVTADIPVLSAEAAELLERK